MFNNRIPENEEEPLRMCFIQLPLFKDAKADFSRFTAKLSHLLVKSKELQRNDQLPQELLKDQLLLK